jgi:hypothetical protein
VIPEALYTLADVNFAEGKNQEGMDLLRQLANDYGYSEWGKRAVQRLRRAMTDGLDRAQR